MKKVSNELISQVFSQLATARWAKIPLKERRRLAPKNGGRPRKWPPCPRYHSHMFSKTTQRCPCGYVRPAKPLSERQLSKYPRKGSAEAVAE